MNTKIYKVRTCKFTDIKKINGIYRLIVDKYIDRYCVLDLAQDLAYDIFTNEQFHILAKTEDNKIASFEKINLGQEYASYIQSLNLSQLSKKELLQLKYAYLKFKRFHNLSNKQIMSKQNIIKR